MFSHHGIRYQSTLLNCPKTGRCSVLGKTRSYPTITGFLPIFLLLYPFQPSYFGTVSTPPTLTPTPRLYPSKSSLARVSPVSSSFNPDLAQFMLYIGRSLSLRLGLEIDAPDDPSRGRHHPSVMPAAPLRPGMEGEKGFPCTHYNCPSWFYFEPTAAITDCSRIVTGIAV